MSEGYVKHLFSVRTRDLVPLEALGAIEAHGAGRSTGLLDHPPDIDAETEYGSEWAKSIGCSDLQQGRALQCRLFLIVKDPKQCFTHVVWS